jgi:hypothetical protein
LAESCEKYVAPLRPWATAAYAVYAGQQVQLVAHGFAAHETIVVREETASGRLATAWTDAAGNGTLGSLTVPPHESRPTYDVVGARSGAHDRDPDGAALNVGYSAGAVPQARRPR